jgi:hypothetical protein
MFLDIIHRPVYISEHNVSETGLCLLLQVKPTQLAPIDRASGYLRNEYGIQSPKRCVLKHKQEGVLDKTRRSVISRNLIFLLRV